METLYIAVRALRAHKLRSFLTLLGVIIGVMTVVVVVSITSGLNRYVAEELFQLSPDVLIFTKFGIITDRDAFLEALRRKDLDRDDLTAVERLCRDCGSIGASVQNQLPVKRDSKRLSRVSVQGSTANLADLNNLELETGRFFSPSEVDHSALVAVIGSDVRDELFGRLDPIGRKFTVGGNPLKVVGLLRKQGTVLGQSQDNQLFMPLSTYERFFGSRQSLNIFVRPAGGMTRLAAVEDEVRVILRARRHTRFEEDDPFGVVTAAAAQNMWRSISAGAFSLMFLVSGISLAVGGIVIANIMLVSVVERTREIGIRRATGARKRDILMQFLAEAVILGGVGGAIGVGLGIAIARGISTFFPLPTLVRPELVVVGLTLALVTGALAGFFPARKAASLPPVEALRYE
ncbi:MAG: ABC transporter permease [Acidobacteriota bacterium]|nr:ABC transporter permease [Acidobacteriota bacterium]